jgi:hypothetical protein
VAGRVTRHTDTVDVAGVVFQLSCRFPKPSFWARRRPEFITSRRPDVVVRIEYAEDFRRRTGRAVADTVADAADVRRRGRQLLVSTGYYRAAVDLRRGRVAVQIAAGFDVAGMMRTLAALWLLERGTVLLHAACFGPAGAATLACGAFSAMPSSTAAGWLAVMPRPDAVSVRPTPFLDGEEPLCSSGWRATTLWLSGAEPPNRSVGAATALRTLLPSIWQADRRRAAVERTLDLAVRVVTTLQCREVGPTGDALEEALVG